jgi:ribose transport system permease protein
MKPYGLPLQQAALAMFIVIVGVVFSTLAPSFLDFRNFANILLQASALALISIGMTYVVLTRGIDLSVGSIVYLSMAAAVALTGTPHAQRIEIETTAAVYPIAMAVGALLGLLNAFVILQFRISPLIATLGTLTLYRGIALHVTGAREIILGGSVLDFGRMQVNDIIGVPVIVTLAVALIAGLTLRHTVFGRHALAVGGNPRSATETGLPVNRILIITYGLTGLLAGIAGLMIVGRIGGLNPDLGWNFEFTVITVVVLGGTSLFGGRGSILGSMLGALLLTMVNNGLNLIGTDPFYYDLIRGLVLISAVSIDAMTTRMHRTRSGMVATT